MSFAFFFWFSCPSYRGVEECESSLRVLCCWLGLNQDNELEVKVQQVDKVDAVVSLLVTTEAQQLPLPLFVSLLAYRSPI